MRLRELLLPFAVLAAVARPVFADAVQPGPELCKLSALRELKCKATPRGVVVGGSSEEAASLTRAIRAAEDRFRIRFGRPGGAHAVLIGPAPQAAVDSLTAAGVSAVLPWSPEKERETALRVSLLKALLKDPKLGEELRKAGLSEADLPELVNEFWDELGVDVVVDTPSSTVASHELGHKWFEAAFPFHEDAPPAYRYGGPGPDWLDEVSALIVEDEASAGRQRADFSKAWKEGQGPAPDALSKFLTRVRTNMAESGKSAQTEFAAVSLADGSRVTSSRGISLQGQGSSDLFYPQARVFSDFLISRSGDPGVLGAVAEALAGGRSFEAWLGSSPAGRKLGGSLGGMEAVWRAWLVSEYGQPSPKIHHHH